MRSLIALGVVWSSGLPGGNIIAGVCVCVCVCVCVWGGGGGGGSVCIGGEVCVGGGSLIALLVGLNSGLL